MEVRARYVLIGAFTLAVTIGGFAFIYWLNGDGFGARASYRIVFHSPVAGLSIGSDVLFNGIRVGEVTNLAISDVRPSETAATIGIEPSLPVRSDTRVELRYGGLTGMPSILLTGGAGDATPLAADAGAVPTLLSAEAAADWTAAAGEAFTRLNDLLSQNSDALHDTVSNVQTFARALGENAGRVNTIVGRLEKMTGSTRPSPNATSYSLVPLAGAPSEVLPPWTLVVPSPTGAIGLETPRFVVGTAEKEDLAFEDAKWNDNIPALMRTAIIASLENAGDANVGTDMQGLAADRQLLLDIRAFRITTGASAPAGEIEFSAKIIGDTGTFIAGRTFHAAAPVEGELTAASAAAAINAAFQQTARDLLPWVLGQP